MRGRYYGRMSDLTCMTARFRLDAILETARAAGGEEISQSELSRRSGVSFTTVNRMCQNHTEQVSLKTLDALSAALTELTGKVFEPGDLIERVPEKKRGKSR